MGTVLLEESTLTHQSEVKLHMRSEGGVFSHCCVQCLRSHDTLSYLTSVCNSSVQTVIRSVEDLTCRVTLFSCIRAGHWTGALTSRSRRIGLMCSMSALCGSSRLA
jgi:hypothetical protein